MKIKILKVDVKELVDAIIKKEKQSALPSMQEGWRFNFNKHIKNSPYSTAYVLVAAETPDIIEGCLIFQMKDKVIPYMAFVEVAPHNKNHSKKYDYVAGCLIAFAFKQSLIQGKAEYKGWLMFDVCEESEKDQVKLMALYSKKYNAVKFEATTMFIFDESGHKLIQQYLGEKFESS